MKSDHRRGRSAPRSGRPVLASPCKRPQIASVNEQVLAALAKEDHSGSAVRGIGTSIDIAEGLEAADRLRCRRSTHLAAGRQVGETQAGGTHVRQDVEVGRAYVVVAALRCGAGIARRYW